MQLRRDIDVTDAPRLWAGPPDRQRTGRAASQLHARFRAVRAGVAALHDDSGHRPPPGRELEHRQRHPTAKSAELTELGRELHCEAVDKLH